jgi:hypothetical protein
MAVLRQKEFTINLGEIVKARFDSFVNVRRGIQAKEEAEFQRTVLDNDLSYDTQLSYRQEQLEKEKGKKYPDNNFIGELKTSETYLRKMVRFRKFRDGYFTFLQDMAGGRKSLQDHIDYLQTTIDETTDMEIKDELKEQLMEATRRERLQKRQIVDSQIEFSRKDQTTDSMNKAIELVKTQLSKPDIIKDEAIRSAYEQQLQTLEKERLEVQVEDKMNYMAINLISKTRQHDSLWKMELFAGFRDGAGNVPVNIGGIRYDSEMAYWQTTLDNYIKNDFANEYVAENQKQVSTTWNKMGILPEVYVKNLVANNNILKNKTELLDFEQVITDAVQGSIADTLSYKAKDLTSKYYLDKPNLATQADYEKATAELEKLKILFQDDYSLSPEIQSVETQLIAKRAQLTKDILATASEYAQAEGIGLEEAVDKYGPTAAVEVPAETFKEKKPMEAAKGILETGKKVPELYKRKEELEGKVAGAKEQVEAKKAAKPVAPKPAVEPTPTKPAPALSATEQRLKKMGLLERYQKIKAEKQAPKPAASAETKKMYNLTRPDGSRSQYHITPTKLQEYLKKPGYSLIK